MSRSAGSGCSTRGTSASSWPLAATGSSGVQEGGALPAQQARADASAENGRDQDARHVPDGEERRVELGAMQRVDERADRRLRRSRRPRPPAAGASARVPSSPRGSRRRPAPTAGDVVRAFRPADAADQIASGRRRPPRPARQRRAATSRESARRPAAAPRRARRLAATGARPRTARAATRATQNTSFTQNIGSIASRASVGRTSSHRAMRTVATKRSAAPAATT